VLPVPLTAAAVVRSGGVASRAELQTIAEGLVATLTATGANLHLVDGSVATTIDQGLAHLMLRGILAEAGGRIGPAPGEDAALGYYAASALQRLGEPEDACQPPAALLRLPSAEGT
jgi:glycerol-3-phosphate O-acyltransferase